MVGGQWSATARISDKGFKLATQNELALDTKPCTRYYVAAKLHTQTTQEWDPVVRYEEPIVECHNKFKV